jgi:hypothetical protein
MSTLRFELQTKPFYSANDPYENTTSGLMVFRISIARS